MHSTVHNDIWLYVKVNGGWWDTMLVAVNHVGDTRYRVNTQSHRNMRACTAVDAHLFVHKHTQGVLCYEQISGFL